MAATTITEYKTRPCTKCGGAGFLSAFQHRKGGECFRCGASGNDPQMIEIVREMTDEEVIAELAKKGFTVMFAERQNSGDWMNDLFLSDEEVEEQKQVMIGARMMLAAI
jgi:hypothetical protein